MRVYIVTSTYRTPSSGCKNSSIKSFGTIEEASVHAKNLYLGYLSDMYYPEDYDETDKNDMFVDESCREHAPIPTIELGNMIFSVETIEKKLRVSTQTPVLLYGPWSNFRAQRPFEINIKSVSNKG